VKKSGAAEYARILSAAYTVAAILAIVSVLWFIRVYKLNSTNAGWGDQEQDRHQALLGWGIGISAAVALGCAILVATRSRRALVSIATGTALSGLTPLVAHLFPTIGMISAFPGIVVALFAFGVHADGYQVTAYTLIVNAIVYSGIVFLLLGKRTVTPVG
jgi:hypothetical protein